MFAQNIKYLLIATGIVFIWRGVWGLADLYLLPEDPHLSFVLSVLIGIGLLLAINWKKGDISELV